MSIAYTEPTQTLSEAPSLDVAQMLARLGANRDRGLTTTEVRARLVRDGPNEVPERTSPWLIGFARKFWGLSAWMIELIALISWLLGKYVDLWIALALLVVNAVLGFLQEQRASAAVTALRRRLQVTARVLRDGEWRSCPARDLVAGDVVRLRSGDLIPADVQVFDGNLQVDQSVVTGESRELAKATGDNLYSGSIVRDGEASGVVTATGTRTFFGRTTELVESAHPKLHVEEVITRVVKWLFLIVGILVGAALVVSVAEGLDLLEILPLSLVLLMSAIPVALPVMFTVSMAVGSMELARSGVLVTRLNAAEDAANLDVLCADKTGTLTMNRLSLTGSLPEPGFTEDDVLRYGALASNEANADPIDLAFLRAARERHLVRTADKVVLFKPFSPKTRKTEASVEHDGQVWTIQKGALRTIAEAARLDLSRVAAIEARAGEEARKGLRAIAVGRAERSTSLQFVGIALLEDAPRPDARQLIRELHSLGISVKMITGDALPVAREIARQLGLGEIARAPDLRAATDRDADAIERAVGTSGFAEVFPEDKFLIVESLQTAGHIVGMTGDGVNDAPALRQAEVGIAVSGATDVAKGAASVVLTTEGLSGIVDLVKNGRAIYQRVLTWIVNKVSRTILKAGFVVVAFLASGKFVISALGMVLLVFMTDFVKIALATDRVRPSASPETWNIGPLVQVAVILGILMLVESLGLLAFAWFRFGLENDGGSLQTFTFQLLLFFALFSIVSIRERSWFGASRPSTLLATALFADACVGVGIGLYGLAELRPVPFTWTLLIVAYAFFCSLLVNDSVKTVLVRRVRKP